MKRIGICVLFLFILLFCSACSHQESSSSRGESTQQLAENAAPLVLIHGNSSNRYVLGYSGELTVEELLEGISQLIGVDLNASQTELHDRFGRPGNSQSVQRRNPGILQLLLDSQ